MENVGNFDEAQFIQDWYNQQREDDRNFITPPGGWTNLGYGCYRTAYKAPSGAVYKVEQYEGTHQSNWGEDETLRRLYWECKFPKGSRLPRWTLYRVNGGNVMAMEYLPFTVNQAYRKADGDPWPLIREMAYVSGLTDMHGGNVAIDEITKEIVPIDLGSTIYN